MLVSGYYFIADAVVFVKINCRHLLLFLFCFKNFNA